MLGSDTHWSRREPRLGTGLTKLGPTPTQVRARVVDVLAKAGLQKPSLNLRTMSRGRSDRALRSPELGYTTQQYK